MLSLGFSAEEGTRTVGGVFVFVEESITYLSPLVFLMDIWGNFFYYYYYYHLELI